jgi:serine/threonine protein kinase
LNLIPTKFEETNWSGRGQHVEYGPKEGSIIDSLLVPKGVLGHSATALVEQVRCKRIMLARKKIRCTGRLPREDAIEEVAHLQRLSHAHVIRGVGTYTIGNFLSILLYPATAHNLETFLDEYTSRISPTPLSLNETQQTLAMQEGIRRSFTCLANTVSFLHESLVKHMDIKPTNILVQEKLYSNEASYKIYLADFGEARSYKNVADVETDSPTSFTRTYAAPEVHRQDMRGFPADIFSLGCVFLEMLAVLAKKKQAFIDLRKQNIMHGSSYQANVQALRHSDLLQDLNSVFLRQPSWHLDSDMVMAMLDPDPDMRPTARTLKVQFGADTWCCSSGPEPFEAVVPAKTDTYTMESLPE